MGDVFFPFPCMTYNISKDTERQLISTFFIIRHIYIYIYIYMMSLQEQNIIALDFTLYRTTILE